MLLYSDFNSLSIISTMTLSYFSWFTELLETVLHFLAIHGVAEVLSTAPFVASC